MNMIKKKWLLKSKGTSDYGYRIFTANKRFLFRTKTCIRKTVKFIGNSIKRKYWNDKNVGGNKWFVLWTVYT